MPFQFVRKSGLKDAISHRTKEIEMHAINAIVPHKEWKEQVVRLVHRSAPGAVIDSVMLQYYWNSELSAETAAARLLQSLMGD